MFVKCVLLVFPLRFFSLNRDLNIVQFVQADQIIYKNCLKIRDYLFYFINLKNILI
jgi:hypothetical protein